MPPDWRSLPWESDAVKLAFSQKDTFVGIPPGYRFLIDANAIRIAEKVAAEDVDEMNVAVIAPPTLEWAAFVQEDPELSGIDSFPDGLQGDEPERVWQYLVQSFAKQNEANSVTGKSKVTPLGWWEKPTYTIHPYRRLRVRVLVHDEDNIRWVVAMDTFGNEKAGLVMFASIPESTAQTSLPAYEALARAVELPSQSAQVPAMPVPKQASPSTQPSFVVARPPLPQRGPVTADPKPDTGLRQDQLVDLVRLLWVPAFAFGSGVAVTAFRALMSSLLSRSKRSDEKESKLHEPAAGEGVPPPPPPAGRFADQ